MTVLLIYIVTIACFPAICVLVQSTHYHTGTLPNHPYFKPNHTILSKVVATAAIFEMLAFIEIFIQIFHLF